MRSRVVLPSLLFVPLNLLAQSFPLCEGLSATPTPFPELTCAPAATPEAEGNPAANRENCRRYSRSCSRSTKAFNRLSKRASNLLGKIETVRGQQTRIDAKLQKCVGKVDAKAAKLKTKIEASVQQCGLSGMTVFIEQALKVIDFNHLAYNCSATSLGEFAANFSSGVIDDYTRAADEGLVLLKQKNLSEMLSGSLSEYVSNALVLPYNTYEFDVSGVCHSLAQGGTCTPPTDGTRSIMPPSCRTCLGRVDKYLLKKRRAKDKSCLAVLRNIKGMDKLTPPYAKCQIRQTQALDRLRVKIRILEENQKKVSCAADAAQADQGIFCSLKQSTCL